ncbi:MAG: hypothetical protein ACRDRY_02200 [Pseudonocardiaceae bacterium]
MAVPRVHDRLGEDGVIHQTHLTQSVEHRFSDFLRNATSAQRIGAAAP